MILEGQVNVLTMKGLFISSLQKGQYFGLLDPVPQPDKRFMVASK